MTATTKRQTLILLGLMILITMVIAVALPDLELQPGMPLPRLQEGQVVAAASRGEDQFVSIPATNFLLVLIELILAGAILYSLYRVFRGADWKTIADILRPLLIITGVLVCFVFLILQLPASLESDVQLETFVSTPEPVASSPVDPVPAPLIWLVGIGLLVITVLVGVWLFTSSRQPSRIDLIGLQAEKARQALKSGAGLKDVIVNCYRQMSLAVKQEQGIERKEFMTTGEFEHVLETAGIPHEPIHQLTRLFDAVRYGNWQPNAVDEQMAIQCLDAIILHTRNGRRV